MKLWQHTLAELVAFPDNDVPYAEHSYNAQTITPLTGHPGFATAKVAGDASGAAQVLLVSEGGGWRQIGHFVDGTLTVYEHRQEGLGRALFLRCVEHLPEDALPVSKHFTRTGFRLLKSAHRAAIIRALAEGQTVSPEVLRDYPEVQRERTIQVIRRSDSTQ